MSGLIRREHRTAEPFEVFGRLDRLFDEWTRLLPLRTPFEPGGRYEDLIRVDEYRNGDDLVVRAALPRLDGSRETPATAHVAERGYAGGTQPASRSSHNLRIRPARWRWRRRPAGC